MPIDNITLIVSAIALIVSVISSLITYKNKYFQEKLLEKNKLRKKVIYIKSFENKFKNEKTKDIEQYLELITSIMKEIYPQSNSIISIKLVEKSNNQNPSESEVITWLSYPQIRYDVKRCYKIKDNTDFSSIVKENKEYFFVYNLKKYSVLKEYINSDRYFIQNYNTSIVIPIQKMSKQNEAIIGFLCIDSTQKLGNVKKNKKIIDIAKSAAELFYDYLIENKLTREAIEIRK